MGLKPQEFLEGKWIGEGEIVGRFIFRLLRPPEPFRIVTKFEKISEKFWLVRDRLSFSRGGEIDRKMFFEQIGSDLFHATADDMPLGADLEVHEQGYSFTPYYSWTCFRGRKWFVRAHEEGSLDDKGQVHGRIKLYWHGIPVAINNFVLRRDVTPNVGQSGSR